MRALLLSTLLAAGSSGPLMANEAGTVEPRPQPALISAQATRGLLMALGEAGPRLVAVGGNGLILLSEDGQSWRQVASPVDTALTAVSFLDARIGWAVGHDAAVLRTEDGGERWSLVSWQPELTSPLFAVQALDAQRVLAVGAFGLVRRSDDGGRQWREVEIPTLSEERLHLNAMTRLADGRLVVVGERGLIAQSADGESWQRQSSGYEGSFFGVLPWGERGALAYGMRGNVYRCEDLASGVWTAVDTGTTTSFFGGHRLDSGEVLLVGAEGTVLRIGPDARAQRLPRAQSGIDETLTGLRLRDGEWVLVGDRGVERQRPPS
ncbi:MAG TPA: YCF48-related protein [Nevskiaceae bacterium]|nr:YCF48-related protein [Nevskiaceae bacterium]